MTFELKLQTYLPTTKIRIERKLGQGGFGPVYLGYDELTESAVAVKVVTLTGSPVDDQKLLREAIAMRKLNHPGILQLYHVVELENCYCFVIQYAPLGSLADRHNNGQPVPPIEVAEYLIQIAAALRAAHDQSVAHCDIKPANILLVEPNRLAVADFGIARLMSPDDATQTLSLFGTMHYMAPELFGRDPRPESDQFSLAVVAYELLSGYLPPTIPAIHPVEPLDGTGKGIIATELWEVIEKALHKNPDERYPTITEFAEAFRQAAQGSAPSAAAVAPVAPVPPVQPPVLQPGQIACSNCTAVNDGKEEFCNYCGIQLSHATVVVPLDQKPAQSIQALPTGQPPVVVVPPSADDSNDPAILRIMQVNLAPPSMLHRQLERVSLVKQLFVPLGTAHPFFQGITPLLVRAMQTNRYEPAIRYSLEKHPEVTCAGLRSAEALQGVSVLAMLLLRTVAFPEVFLLSNDPASNRVRSALAKVFDSRYCDCFFLRVDQMLEDDIVGLFPSFKNTLKELAAAAREQRRSKPELWLQQIPPGQKPYVAAICKPLARLQELGIPGAVSCFSDLRQYLRQGLWTGDYYVLEQYVVPQIARLPLDFFTMPGVALGLSGVTFLELCVLHLLWEDAAFSFMGGAWQKKFDRCMKELFAHSWEDPILGAFAGRPLQYGSQEKRVVVGDVRSVLGWPKPDLLEALQHILGALFPDLFLFFQNREN